MLRHLLSRQFIKYVVTGAANTAVGFCTIFLLYKMGLPLGFSNFMGYLVGLTLSFFLSKQWVFSLRNQTNKYQIMRFVLSFLVSFILSFMFLKMMMAMGNGYILSQCTASFVYFILFYLLQKYFVFKRA